MHICVIECCFISIFRFRSTITLSNIFRFLPTKNNRRMREIDREIRKTLREIIRKREKAIKDGKTNNDDLLGLLLESNMNESKGNAKLGSLPDGFVDNSLASRLATSSGGITAVDPATNGRRLAEALLPPARSSWPLAEAAPRMRRPPPHAAPPAGNHAPLPSSLRRQRRPTPPPSPAAPPRPRRPSPPPSPEPRSCAARMGLAPASSRRRRGGRSKGGRPASTRSKGGRQRAAQIHLELKDARCRSMASGGLPWGALLPSWLQRRCCSSCCRASAASTCR